MFKKILCPLDGSDPARHAVSKAIELARQDEAELVLLHVLLRNADATGLARFAEIEGLTSHIDAEVNRLRAVDGRVDIGHTTYDESRASSRVLVELGQHLLDDARFDATEQGLHAVETVLADGDPAEVILRCVEDQHADCIVMGGRGLSGLKAFLLGSVSYKVANQAPCTVMIVK